MIRSLAVGCLAILFSNDLALADLLYFARGGQVQLPATAEGEWVRLETPDGPKVFPRSDFLAIVPGHDPTEEWAARRDSALRSGSVDEKFAAAWWALENGLTGEAIASLGELRDVASGQEASRRAIAGLDAIALPCPDPDLDSLRNHLLPLRFRELRSDHVVLLHQVGEPEARERLDVLERVVRTFTIALAIQGIEPPPPRRRLVSVYFADRGDYARSLRLADAGAFVDTHGYYHPILRAVFAFDSRGADEQRMGRRAIANRSRDAVAGPDLARRALLLDLDWRANDLGIAAHETIHQLVAEAGLAPRFDDFPLWLHEGLAAQFEVVRGGRWAGFGRSHDLRLPDWRSIQPAPRLLPLLQDVGFGHGYRRDVYAESWALVYFLRKTRPREFLTFLDRLRAPIPVATSRPDRALDAFRAAFGDDLAGIELSWHRYLADLKTPLESGRPAPPETARPRGPSELERRLVGPDPAH